MTREATPFEPLRLHSRGQITTALIGRRHALGLTCEDLDDRAGWADRYTNKLEVPHRPSGRSGFHFGWPDAEVLPTGKLRCTAMADVWLESLGVALVLVDRATADAIGALPAPAPTGDPRPGWTGGDASRGHSERRINQGKRGPMSVAAYQANDRTLVAHHAFRVSVADHEFVAARPALKAEADAIAARMASLANQIREAA